VGFYNHSGDWKTGLVIDYVEVKWIGDITKEPGKREGGGQEKKKRT
jgi:hypothetical protein